MRHRWVVAAVAILACKGSDPRGPGEPRTKPQARPQTLPATTFAGQPARVGQIERAPTGLMLGVVAPVGADLAAIEADLRAKAKTAKLAVDVSQTTALALELDTAHAAYMVGADGLDFTAIERSGVVAVSIDKPNGLDDLRALSALIADAATRAHGWVFDANIGGVFAADKFAAHVPGTTPDARWLIAVHTVGGEGDAPFLDTMGMERLGLPELYVDAMAPGQARAITMIVDATAQTLIVRGDLSRPGELDVDLAALDPSWRLDEIRKAGGTGKVTWHVRWSRGDDAGDGNAPLKLELVPPTGTGIEGVTAVIDGYFGNPPDPMASAAADDPELLAAGARARKDLAGLRAHFAKGVPAGEQLAVKAPFSTADGFVEWMWVDVIRWRKDELTGTLDNDPEYVTTLHAGQQVTVKLGDLADYLHVLADGTQVGGYSVEILRKRGAIPDE